MKVIILGAGSFAGQAIFSSLLERGVSVLGINRSQPCDSSQWPWRENYDPKDKWFKFNITDSVDEISRIISKEKPNIIIDFMGQGMVAQSWQYPALWYETNIAKKAELLNNILKLDSLEKYIRASTPEVYGSNKKFLKETSPFKPSTPYAVSHAAIDQHIRCLGDQFSFPYVIGRFGNFYGEGQQLYRVIPRLFLSCLSGKKFILDGGGKSSRSFIYSADIVNAFDLMIRNSKNFEEYNFNSNEEISISDLVDKVCFFAGKERNSFVEEGPERPGKDMHYRLDIQKSKDLLGWEPKVFLDEGLIKVKNWINDSYAILKDKSWNFSLKN